MIVVTGTGRSGTGYMSRLLGIGHESTFTAEGIDTRHVDWDDSSFAAVPFLPILRAHIIHVVRDPRTCIPSLARGSVFDLDQPESTWRRFIWTFAPGVFTAPTPLARAETFWVYWNEMIEPYANELVRLEEISAEDVSRWSFLLGDDEIPARWRELPTNVNARPKTRYAEPLEILSPRVEEARERYGYR